MLAKLKIQIKIQIFKLIEMSYLFGCVYHLESVDWFYLTEQLYYVLSAWKFNNSIILRKSACLLHDIYDFRKGNRE